jgi:hypothetical protein
MMIGFFAAHATDEIQAAGRRHVPIGKNEVGRELMQHFPSRAGIADDPDIANMKDIDQLANQLAHEFAIVSN